jgi:hypothetical protein
MRAGSSTVARRFVVQFDRRPEPESVGRAVAVPGIEIRTAAGPFP